MSKVKRIFIVVFVVLISFTLIGAEGSADKKFFISLKGNFLSPSDGSYKDIYGSSLIYPGVRAGRADRIS